MTTVTAPLRPVIRQPLRWAGRGLLYLALGVIVLRGVMAIASPPSQAPAAAAAHSGPSFPLGQASAYACQFALTYLTFDATAAGAWQTAVQGFQAGGSNTAQLGGWDGHGRQQAMAAQTLAVHPTSDNAASVDVAVLVNPSGAAQRWLYLEVSVVTSGGGYAIVGTPLFVGAPPRAALGPPPSFRSDLTLSGSLKGLVGAFFGAYATANTAALAYFLAPGANVVPLGNGLNFTTLSSLTVEAGNGPSHTAVATVVWQDPVSGGSFTQSYRLTLTQTGGRWYVVDIGAVDPSLAAALN